MSDRRTRSLARLAGKISLVLALVAAILVGGVASPADAKRKRRTNFPNAKVVAPWGNDGNGGDADNPWQTLGHASRMAQPGDVILIRSGTYTNQLVNVATRGEDGRPVVFRNYPGERPVIQGTGGHAPDGSKVWGAVHVVEPAAHLVFAGLDIRGTSDTIETAGVSIWRAHHITIRHNRITGFGGGGVNAASSEELRIHRNLIRDNAQRRPEAPSGISIYQPVDFDGGNSGYTNTISGNRISHNENLVPGPSGEFTDGNCIVLDRYRDVGYWGDTLIKNNVCFANGGRGIHVFRSDNAHVVNNTLYHNRGTSQLTGDGELSTYEASNVTFRNNLVWARPGLRGANPYLSDNVVFDNNVYVGGTGTTNGPGDRVVSDAKLRNPGTHTNANFRLKPGSPLIDSGTTNGAPPRDKANRKRKSNPDVGAFEHR